MSRPPSTVAAARSAEGDGRYEERRAPTLLVGAFLSDVVRAGRTRRHVIC